MTEPTTHPLDVPAAVLTCDVRPNDSSTESVLLLIGSSMGVAERLGMAPVMFRSGHGGFLGDEYGQPGEPEAFASMLRKVLAAQA